MTIEEWIIGLTLLGLAIEGVFICLATWDFHQQYLNPPSNSIWFRALRDRNVLVATAFVVFVLVVGYLIYADDFGLPRVPVIWLWLVIVTTIVILGFGPIRDDLRVRRTRGLWPYRRQDG